MHFEWNQPNCRNLILACMACLWIAAPAAAAECRVGSLPDGAKATFCKDETGHWKQQEEDDAPGLSARDQSGNQSKIEATYDGTYQVSIASRQRQARAKPALRGRNLFDVMINAASDAASGPGGANATSYEGAIKLALTINGAAVTAKVSGTGIFKAASYSGLVREGFCHLIDARNVESIEGKCGAKGFSGTIKSLPGNRQSYSGTFEATVTSYVDATKRDAERAVLQKQCDAGKASACVKLDTQ